MLSCIEMLVLSQAALHLSAHVQHSAVRNPLGISEGVLLAAVFGLIWHVAIGSCKEDVYCASLKMEAAKLVTMPAARRCLQQSGACSTKTYLLLSLQKI